MDRAPLLLDGVVVGKRADSPKPPQKKTIVKPKPKEVVEISSDTQEDDGKASQEIRSTRKMMDNERRRRKQPLLLRYSLLVAS